MKDGNTDATCYSECSQDNNQRTLHVPEGNGAPRIEARDKVSIVEKLNEVLVEATLTYGNEVYDPIESCLLLAFANTMKREGYHLGGDHIQNAPHDVAGSSSSHPHILFCPTPAAETVELVPPTPIIGQSPNLLNPFSGSVSTFMEAICMHRHRIIFLGAICSHPSRTSNLCYHSQLVISPHHHLKLLHSLAPCIHNGSIL